MLEEPSAEHWRKEMAAPSSHLALFVASSWSETAAAAAKLSSPVPGSSAARTETAVSDAMAASNARVAYFIFLPSRSCTNLTKSRRDGWAVPPGERCHCLPTVLTATIDMFWLTALLVLLFCFTWKAPGSFLKARSSISLQPATGTVGAGLPGATVMRLA